jgi:hypothetical protein
MQTLANALDTFTIATALVWTHTHVTVGIGPSGVAITHTLPFIAKAVTAAVVHTQRLAAVLASETRLADTVCLEVTGITVSNAHAHATV